MSEDDKKPRSQAIVIAGPAAHGATVGPDEYAIVTYFHKKGEDQIIARGTATVYFGPNQRIPEKIASDPTGEYLEHAGGVLFKNV